MKQSTSNLLGYRARAERCEGVYEREASLAKAYLVSFTTESDLKDLCSGDPQVRLLLSPAQFSQTDNTPIHIVAESLRPDLYYRMDVDVSPRTPEFVWPLEPRCNNLIRLAWSELGIIARTPRREGPERQNVIVPVALSLDRRPVSPPYRALLMPTGLVREVYFSLWHYGADGTPSSTVSNRRLITSHYLPETPIAVLFEASVVQKPGVYRARVTVEFDDEHKSVALVDFYFREAR